ncbi:MAG TPA: hypothetical protein VF509_07600 [Sphingobium sp.]
MTRILCTLAATAITASLIALHAGGAVAAQPGARQTISVTADGQPILLKRMIVTATALPDTQKP